MCYASSVTQIGPARYERRGRVNRIGVRLSQESTTPYGYCQCGCGGKTRIALKTSTRDGRRKGEPLRYLYNHHGGRPRDSAATAEARYWANVQVAGPDECWLWTGATVGGYGSLGHQSKATHFALTLDGRPRPDGKQANHTCDVPACCNPRHLYWGTQRENVADMVNRGRGRNGATKARS